MLFNYLRLSTSGALGTLIGLRSDSPRLFLHYHFVIYVTVASLLIHLHIFSAAIDVLYQSSLDQWSCSLQSVELWHVL